MKEFFCDEGHFFDFEELYFYAIWQINNLKKQGYSKPEIIEFHDYTDWRNIAKKLLE